MSSVQTPPVSGLMRLRGRFAHREYILESNNLTMFNPYLLYSYLGCSNSFSSAWCWTSNDLFKNSTISSFLGSHVVCDTEFSALLRWLSINPVFIQQLKMIFQSKFCHISRIHFIAVSSSTLYSSFISGLDVLNADITCFLRYRLLIDAITPVSESCENDVVLAGRKTIVTLFKLSSVTLEPWQEALSISNATDLPVVDPM